PPFPAASHSIRSPRPSRNQTKSAKLRAALPGTPIAPSRHRPRPLGRHAMAHGGKRWLFSWLPLVLLLAAAGCAAQPPRVTPLAAAAAGPMGVVAGPFPPRLILEPPPAGGAAGAARGVGAGFASALGSGDL